MNAAIDHVIQRQDTWLGNKLQAPQSGLSSGFSKLDEELYGNGWPMGNTIELLSDGAGLGSMGLFLPAMCHQQCKTDPLATI